MVEFSRIVCWMSGKHYLALVNTFCPIHSNKIKQVALWATIGHLGASIMFGDTIIDDAQKQVTLNLKQ